MKYHSPVLLSEVMGFLQPGKGRYFIDCTLGDAGHTLAILGAGGSVLGLEANEDALERAKQRISLELPGTNFKSIRSNFNDLKNAAQKEGISQVHGVLYDLGLSSYELDEGGFGLSFKNNEELDMRYDKSYQLTAADLLNALPQKQLEKIIYEYSQERFAKRFAQKIVDFRNLKKFRYTRDLVDLLENEAPPNYEHGRIHPATRTFMALRIAVNNELENLRESLPQAARLLLPGGRMVIISYHSLEDKIAKTFGHSVQPSLKALVKKPIIPSQEEVEKNPRARSAKMRVYERS